MHNLFLSFLRLHFFWFCFCFGLFLLWVLISRLETPVCESIISIPLHEVESNVLCMNSCLWEIVLQIASLLSGLLVLVPAFLLFSIQRILGVGCPVIEYNQRNITLHPWTLCLLHGMGSSCIYLYPTIFQSENISSALFICGIPSCCFLPYLPEYNLKLFPC